MADRGSKKAGKVGKKAAARQRPAKASKRKASKRKASKRKAPKRTASKRKASKRKAAPKSGPRKGARPVLLAGGNPQIAKGYGDGPVQAYIAAMPGWKSDVGRRLDALIERTVPGVCKAVKWNSALYGVVDQGWFVGLHVFENYVKVAFFRGSSLRPVPPGVSKSQDTRYLDLRENDDLDEAQLARWIEQASQLPGEDL